MMDLIESCNILGIQDSYNLDNLDEQGLKKLYRKKMVKYHPDSPNGDTEKAAKLTDAYNLILKIIKDLKLLSVSTNKEQITTVIEISQLIKLYQGGSINLKSADKTKELKANEIARHNVFINISVTVMYDGVEYSFNEVNKYDIFDKYKCNCKIMQSDISEPLEVTVKCCGVSRTIKMETRSLDLILTLDSDIKVTVQLERKIVSDN